MHVRFGGERLETCRRNTVRRWALTLPDDEPCADPDCDICKPGAEPDRAELPALPDRPGIPGIFDHGLCGDLRGADPEHPGLGAHRSDPVGDRRLHGAACLYLI